MPDRSTRRLRPGGRLRRVSRVRVLRAEDVRRAIDMRGCIEACERAFVAYSSGKAELPGVIHLDVPEAEGEIHVLHLTPR